MRVMIMAGGTGGHVFPALAVATALRERGAEVFWLGTRQGLEAKLVPAAGIAMEWVSVSGLRGKGVVAWLLAPLRLLWAAWQVLVVMVRQRPMVVLGMGGFVTGPGGVVTWLLRKPLVIHEQNAIAGLTNRLLAPLAQRVLEAFPTTFHTKRTVLTGNPVRRAIAELPAPEQRFAGRSGATRLLVLGGSLGARALNEVVPQAIAHLPMRPEIWHQAGSRNIDEARDFYSRAAVSARVEPFIDDMAAAYAWADLVLCRAGALTVAELAAAGVAAILVPYPHAVDDHQTRNAAYLADAGAALVVQERDLTSEKLCELLISLGSGTANSPHPNPLPEGEGDFEKRNGLLDRARLLKMAQAARRLSQPQAAANVAEQCWEVALG
jgi:UDP-N-acetylglucosamine--N-acetylmuramyl-(pentapeptide) pyrophosphoryl-undecaprenol N-acetylglucosamine transferase